ncbi:GDSL-type esterase/lipase family protein [Brachybacterium sp. AOP29-B2-41]|uniref:GDSL-type esterase/lipase family protein n=1 Tax=Brachybacterium sp. AOP29-B2-41 TaxID=3457704 RepID=UPI00403499F8
MTSAVPTTRRVMPTDLPEAWSGAATWTQTAAGAQPWRVAPAQLERIMNAEVEELARIPNGVRLAVDTDASALEVELTTTEAHANSARCLDVVVDGELVATREAGGNVTARIELPGKLARVELRLPHAAPTTVQQVLLHSVTQLAPAPPRGPRWAVHGSSITQCNQADSPTGTWPALVAAQNSYELTALGMSGQCHLDPPLAETIGRSRPDLVTLCLGANVYGANTFSERSLPPAMIGFVDCVRRLTEAPIVVMSSIAAGPHREDQPNPVGLTQRQIRDLVHRSVEVLQRLDPLISLIDGTEILGFDEMELLGDLLHPTAEGYRVMAERLAPRLAGLLD